MGARSLEANERWTFTLARARLLRCMLTAKGLMRETLGIRVWMAAQHPTPPPVLRDALALHGTALLLSTRVAVQPNGTLSRTLPPLRNLHFTLLLLLLLLRPLLGACALLLSLPRHAARPRSVTERRQVAERVWRARTTCL